MDSVITLSAPLARLEMSKTKRIELYLGYEYAEYVQVETADGWWHRTLALHPDHWLRLSGAATIDPWNALQLILAQPDRSPIPLPPLLVALFLSLSAHPSASEQRQLFQWVAYAVREMLPVLPVSGREAGWNTVSDDQIDELVTSILTALLPQAATIPWPQRDGVEVQALVQLANMLWTFPPTLTRQIPEVANAYFQQRLVADQQWLEDDDGILQNEDASLEDDDPISITRWSLLGNLGAMQFWRTPWPLIRRLSVQAPMHELLFTWYQALVIMHPDAPIIDDADLAWLCDGTLGAPYDAPFGHLLAACTVIETLNIPVTSLYERIAALQQDAGQGRYLPDGRWELPVPAAWPVVWAYGAAKVRLIASSDGCWVRLMPAQWSWGSVLWWRPHSDPPTCWTLAFSDDATSLCLVGLHTALWELWRDLRVDGQPARSNGAGRP